MVQLRRPSIHLMEKSSRPFACTPLSFFVRVDRQHFRVLLLRRLQRCCLPLDSSVQVAQLSERRELPIVETSSGISRTRNLRRPSAVIGSKTYTLAVSSLHYWGADIDGSAFQDVRRKNLRSCGEDWTRASSVLDQ